MFPFDDVIMQFERAPQDENDVKDSAIFLNINKISPKLH